MVVYCNPRNVVQPWSCGSDLDTLVWGFGSQYEDKDISEKELAELCKPSYIFDTLTDDLLNAPASNSECMTMFEWINAGCPLVEGIIMAISNWPVQAARECGRLF